MIASLAALLVMAPVKVEVVQTPAGWELRRGGKPYFVKGAGGTQRMQELKAAGGNSMRGWGADRAGEELDAAQKMGLTYTVGIWLGHRSYFDYSNPTQLEEQRKRVREAVQKHRNHPALLVWGLGNEMEVDNNDTPTLWKEIEYLARETKRLDPNHPVMTVVAEVSKEKIDRIKTYAPSIDILGVNSYGGLRSLNNRLREFGWTKPYLVTEFGTLGPWERPKTPWGAALEMTSSEKAAFTRESYLASIQGGKGQSLGGYVFLWGDKQEETPTWFGMFLPTGERLEIIDVMTELWSGKAPRLLAPRVRKFDLDIAGKDVAIGTTAVAKLDAVDPNRDKLTYRWKIKREVEDKKYAGEGEQRPGDVASSVDQASGPEVRFTVPAEPGAYRLYVTVLDGTGRAGTANAPFHVRR